MGFDNPKIEGEGHIQFSAGGAELSGGSACDGDNISMAAELSGGSACDGDEINF